MTGVLRSINYFTTKQMNNIVKFTGDDQPIHFGWELIDTCQYRCSYCYFLKSLKKRPTEKYLNNYRTVLSRLKLKKIGEYNLELLGGEPTNHPFLTTILQEMESIDNCLSVELVTNFARPVEQYYCLSEYDKLKISISCHPEYVKRESFIEKCLNIDKKIPNNIQVNVNMIHDKKYWEDIKMIIDDLLSMDIYTRCNFIHPVENVYDELYTDEFYVYFDEHLNRCDNPEYTYQDSSGDEHKIKEHEVRRQEMFHFAGKYNCTPTMWYIDSDARFYNYCTGEELDLLGSNIKNTVVCPVDRGCKDCNMLLNYNKELIK